MLALAGVGEAATNEFYENLYRRGVAHFDAGSFDAATRELRLASFGMLDDVDRYETAQIYIALAQQKLSRPADARETLQRLIAAERLRPRYNALTLPPAIRTQFKSLLDTIATADQRAFLAGSKPGTPAATTESAHATTTAPPVVDRVVVEEVHPTPASVPAPRTPATTQQQAANDPPARPATPAPQPRVSQPATPAPAHNVTQLLADAEHAIGTRELERARSLYRTILDQPNLSHATAVRVAEGLYRTRDFANTVRAFRRIGTLTTDEQPYRYYLAVALYETGDYAGAKREIAAALPYIEVTPDVERYRAKIEGAAP